MLLTLKLIYEKISKEEAKEVIKALKVFAAQNDLILEKTPEEANAKK